MLLSLIPLLKSLSILLIALLFSIEGKILLGSFTISIGEVETPLGITINNRVSEVNRSLLALVPLVRNRTDVLAPYNNLSTRANYEVVVPFS